MEKVTEQQQEEEHFVYPFPEDCYATWKRWQPEEHYRRLFDASDEEARLHLLDLILCKLKTEYYESSILKTGVSREDLAHQIWMKIIGKIRSGSLVMREPKKFYGMLKKIIFNGITDNFRRNGWHGIDRIGDLCRGRFSSDDGDEVDEGRLWELRDCQNIEMTCNHRYILQQILIAIAQEAPMEELERKALILSILAKIGRTELSSNADIATALSADTGIKIGYQKTGTLIHDGMMALKRYLGSKKIDWRAYATPVKVKK
ncbi:hypothetical protein C4565_10115 [Candidatus Parcubacteria bacterium]|nr:MAG: hypothetical protein C4565_10115 [Candidatus Parcubacteria bacterium]